MFVRIISFKYIKVNGFKKIIIENLSKENKYTLFISYLKRYIFKMNPLQYNYSKLIEYIKENNKSNFKEKLFTTNDICENINSKLNFNLPKKSLQMIVLLIVFLNF